MILVLAMIQKKESVQSADLEIKNMKGNSLKTEPFVVVEDAIALVTTETRLVCGILELVELLIDA